MYYKETPANMSAPATPPAAPETSTPAPAAQPVSTAPATPAEAAKMESGGETKSDTGASDRSIQWVAIGIFALAMIGLAMKTIYYHRAIKQQDYDKNNTQKKLKELEKNVRAVRKDKYESST